MALSAYRYYRLVFLDTTYTAINEISMHAAADGSGANLLSGATASSNGSFSPSTPSMAIDGNTSTFWESATSTPGNWIAFDLGSAQTVASLKTTSTAYPGEVPRNFYFQVSLDGSSWTTIGFFAHGTNGVAHTDKLLDMSRHIAGVSTVSGGGASHRVLIYDWTSGTLVASIVPFSSGAFEFRVASTNDLLVTHIGPSGFRPLSDGPITPGV